MSDMDNGALLAVCEAEYDAFVTLDQSIRYQQNLRGRPIAVIILRAKSNRLEDLAPLVPALSNNDSSVRQGEIALHAPARKPEGGTR
jgi:hypothetical protein